MGFGQHILKLDEINKQIPQDILEKIEQTSPLVFIKEYKNIFKAANLANNQENYITPPPPQ